MSVLYVRQMIADSSVTEIFTATGDGISNLFLLPNTPIQAGSEVISIAGAIIGSGFTVNESTGVLSFTAPPANGAPIAVAYAWQFFSDSDLQSFINSEGDDYMAAAQALDTMASNMVLVMRKIKDLDIDTDGPAVAKALHDHADKLRKQAANNAGVDWAEMVVDNFNWQERMRDNYYRSIP